MKNTNETQTLSKVDTETSDIFFNFGAKSYLAICEESSKHGFVFDGDRYLLEDAKNFLDIVHRPYLPEQLVQDFRDRS